MTVPAQTPINRHVGNGVTTVFPFTFKVLSADDLEVSVGGVVQTSGFTVSGVGANSGDVTFTTAPAADFIVVLRRVMAIQRTTDYQDQGAMPAATVDDDHDATVMMVQQVAAVQASALQYPVLEGISGTLPAAESRSGKFLAFDDLGRPTMAVPVVDSSADVRLDLALTSGGQFVGVDDGESGALFTTAQGGIDFIADTLGIDVRRYGARSTVGSINDCTAAFQAAINASKALNTGNVWTLGGGYAKIKVPKGFWVVSDDLDLSGFNGLEIEGDGPQSTVILFTKQAGTLFYFNGYLNIRMSNLSLFEGTVSIVSGKPTWAPHATKDSTAFRFNGATSGTDFQMDNVIIGSFGTVFKTLDGVVNCDNHVYNHCRFYTNNLIWDNTNPNAVIWSFNECKAYFNAKVFRNPGSTMRINGGDWINPGDFIEGGLANTTTDIICDGIRFESYQNIDPSSNPRVLNLTGGTGTITFRNCTQRGGGSLAGKTSATIAGLWNIKCESCFLPGNWAVTVGSSLNGITGSIVFESCDGVPNVVQTLVGGQSSRPLNIEYRRHRQSTAGYVDRIFHGALSSQSLALTDNTARDMFRFEGVLNASSGSKSCPVFVVDPYIVQFVGAEIEFWSNGIQTVVISVWTDSTKTTKLGEVTTAVAQNQYQMLEIPLSGVLARHQITPTSNPLFVEFVAANNAGTCRANITMKYRQVN